MTTTLPGSPANTAEHLKRQAIRLAWFTVVWNVVEAVVALSEGVSANSSALIGFGLDSTVEVSSAAIVLWQFRAELPEQRERQALRWIAVSFFALAAWVIFAASGDLLNRSVPESSIIGIGLAIASLIVMPFLAMQKRRVGQEMGAATVVADSAQTWLCSALSAVLLVGLLANAALGWWWADPVAGLMIGAVSIREGINAWRGHNCCDPQAGSCAVS